MHIHAAGRQAHPLGGLLWQQLGSPVTVAAAALLFIGTRPVPPWSEVVLCAGSGLQLQRNTPKAVLSIGHWTATLVLMSLTDRMFACVLYALLLLLPQAMPVLHSTANSRL